MGTKQSIGSAKETYRQPWRLDVSRISWACRYSNAAVPQAVSPRMYVVQRLADLHRRLALVQRVKVQAVDPIGQQVLALLDRVIDARGMHRLGIVLEAFQVRQ